MKIYINNYNVYSKCGIVTIEIYNEVFNRCKYGYEDCPVVKGLVKQNFLCMDCYDDLSDESYHNYMLVQIEEIKKLKIELEKDKEK